MIFISAQLILLNSIAPLWTAMCIASIFKKEELDVIAENAINHPLLYSQDLVFIDKQLVYKEEELI